MRKSTIFLGVYILPVALAISIYAQEAATSSNALDSIVQLTAESQGLALVPQGATPTDGTFWEVTAQGVTAPLPCLLRRDQGAPIYSISDNIFLVDASGGLVDLQSLGATTTADALEILADQVANTITQIQTALASQQMRPMTDDLQAMDASSGFTPAFSFSTDSLWLQIMGVTNGIANLILNNATDQVYEVVSKTDLTATNWNIESGVLLPTNSTAMPFTVPVLDRTNALFIWAMDWTGVTENGNTVPDWWFWKYYGKLALSDSTLDSQGSALLYDYTNGFDPNIISFTLSFTNQYAKAFGAPAQLNVTAGEPFYCAVLIDDTNQANANWVAYTSSNITVNLGSTEGWHEVYVGLRGLPPDAYQTWETARLKLDLTPPLLVITNPASGLVTQPLIQLQGYSPEALASISYDLTNATGLITNQQILILGQSYDTNTLEYTTNYFQCFDVPLTNGLNIVTLNATDLAGNVTTTNFNFTLDYSSATNPPVVRLDWPQDGTQISGSSFTWRGWVSDPTAQVTAQIVDTNGAVDSVIGQVGRDGSFYIEGMPLSGGTNSLSLTATDAAGNTSVTNISVVQSTLMLTITSAGLGQAVTGTISDPANYTIWVNGMMATNNGDGTWIAPDPHLTLDTPTVQVRAIPNSDHGGYGDGGGQ